MRTLILLDWSYPCIRKRMTDAERWTAEHGFTRGTEFVNNSGQKLAELLDSEPDATESGTVYLRWTFPDRSAVVLGQCTWRTLLTRQSGPLTDRSSVAPAQHIPPR